MPLRTVQSSKFRSPGPKRWIVGIPATGEPTTQKHTGEPGPN